MYNLLAKYLACVVWYNLFIWGYAVAPPSVACWWWAFILFYFSCASRQPPSQPQPRRRVRARGCRRFSSTHAPPPPPPPQPPCEHYSLQSIRLYDPGTETSTSWTAASGGLRRPQTPPEASRGLANISTTNRKKFCHELDLIDARLHDFKSVMFLMSLRLFYFPLIRSESRIRCWGEC